MPLAMGYLDSWGSLVGFPILVFVATTWYRSWDLQTKSLAVPVREIAGGFSRTLMPYDHRRCNAKFQLTKDGDCVAEKTCAAKWAV